MWCGEKCWTRFQHCCLVLEKNVCKHSSLKKGKHPSKQLLKNRETCCQNFVLLSSRENGLDFLVSVPGTMMTFPHPRVAIPVCEVTANPHFPATGVTMNPPLRGRGDTRLHRLRDIPRPHPGVIHPRHTGVTPRALTEVIPLHLPGDIHPQDTGDIRRIGDILLHRLGVIRQHDPGAGRDPDPDRGHPPHRGVTHPHHTGAVAPRPHPGATRLHRDPGVTARPRRSRVTTNPVHRCRAEHTGDTTANRGTARHRDPPGNRTPVSSTFVVTDSCLL